MTYNRIERLERDLVARRRRRSRRGATRDRPVAAAGPTSRAFDTDDGGPINLLCDRPGGGFGVGASYVDAFEAVEAVDTVASVEIDATPSIDDPTTAGRVDPTGPVAPGDPTTAGAIDPTTGGRRADPTIDVAPQNDPTIGPPSPPSSPVPPPRVVPPPAMTAPGDLGGWQVTSEAADQEAAFAQDIAAILAHTSGDDVGPTPMPVPAPPRQQQTPAPATPQPGVGASSGHDIFDRIAAANRYDQGPIALSVDFAAMDRAIDRGETAAPPPPPPVAPPDAALPTAGAAPGTTGSRPAPGPANAPAPTAPADADIADVAAIEAITAASGPFRVTTDVPLVAQVPGLSCHAAACASIVAWRDDVAPVAADVAAGAGFWERFAEGRSAVYPDVLDVFGLAHSVVGPAGSAAALKALIEKAGPLWVAASPPGERAVVISGVTGDGTSSGTVVDVVDPWARGMTMFASPNPGSTYHQSLAELLAGIAGNAGNPVVIAQLKEGRVR